MGPKLWSITGARSHTATTPNRLYYYFILLILNELREPHQRLLGNVSCLAPFFFRSFAVPSLRLLFSFGDDFRLPGRTGMR
jgi:hypothetical protein